jgi:hypothetical protein
MTNIEKNPYVRVGIFYFKEINDVLISGDFVKKLNKWSLNIIKDDHPALVRQIPKYDSFCVIPDHLNYSRNIHNLYNRYEPFSHIPIKGNFTKTLEFLHHVFDEQIEIGLDYFKLLLENPVQILPILCLVSESRNTGKTTFLNYMKSIFGGNMTINTNEDFRSQFNSHWGTKLIIGVDEVLLDRIEDSERIKSLSTSRTVKIESKGVDKNETEFFGKFILCSNNEETFIRIDPEETRYWVRKIPVLKTDNTNLLEDLKKEIPAFLYFLIQRKFSTEKNSRMWFTPQQIYTTALLKVKRSNKTSIEKELKEIITNEMENYELDSICFTNVDLMHLLKESGIKATRFNLSLILNDKWNLEQSKTPNTYKKYFMSPNNDQDFAIRYEYKKGRFYTFKKEMFKDFL